MDKQISLLHTNTELIISNKTELTNIIYNQQNYITLQYHLSGK